MTTKVVSVLKHIGVFSIVFFTIISCEKEIESIGVNLVDNDKFTPNNSLPINVVTTNENVERVISSNIPQYLLGAYSDDELGKLEASIVTQILLPETGEDYSYGTNAAIDAVFIDIPYQSTKGTDDDKGNPTFSIDSVFGSKSGEFQLSVYRLETFLNNLDPSDPSKNAVYYSDKEFSKGETPLYSEIFKIKPKDTTLVKRYLSDGTQYDTDSIIKTEVGPSILFELDKAKIQHLFVDNVENIDFSSVESFQRDFNGLYIEAVENDPGNSPLVSLNMAGSKMTIYYSNDENEGEDEDLNGNGVNGEQGVRVKHSYDFSFGTSSTLKSNILKRTDDIIKTSGEDKLYLQGAAGSIATVELFVNENLEELRNRNLLITNASLKFYIDTDAGVVETMYPEQLFLFNLEENDQVLDVLTEGANAIGGLRDFEFDENNKKVLLNSYTFTITDYISELLKYKEEGEETSVELVKLGLKVFNNLTDLPESATDTRLKDFSWNPKGVVLFGHDVSTEDIEKKIQLEITYTEINN